VKEVDSRSILIGGKSLHEETIIARVPIQAPIPLPTSSGIQDVGGSGTIGPGSAGVGGGTLIAIIASTLPEGTWKTVLIWFAPVSTLVFSTVWEWIRTYYVDRKAMRDLIATRTVIDESMQYPGLPEEVLKEFQAKRVLVERMIIRLQFSKIPVHISNGNQP